MTRGGRPGGPLGGPIPQGGGSDSAAVLRLLGTLREGVEQIRAKQAEIYEVVLSYKHQLAKLETTVLEKLQGLPKSPYIAGQLVPMPRKQDGVDNFRDLLATYLHPSPPGAAEDEDDKPVDVDLTPEPDPPEAELEDEPADDDAEDDDRRHRREREDRPRGPQDEDTRGLHRGPERDVEPFDLSAERKGDDGDDGDGDGDGDDELPGEAGAGEAGGTGSDDETRGRRRRRRRRRGGGSGEGRDRGGRGDAPRTSGPGDREPSGRAERPAIGAPSAPRPAGEAPRAPAPSADAAPRAEPPATAPESPVA